MTGAVDAKSSSGDFFSEDDWGDFVTIHSDQINGGFELSNAKDNQSPLDPSQNQKPLDFFGNSVDNVTVLNRVESVPIRVDSLKAQWVKPQGAIPLSLFGEAEEEEEKNFGVGEPTVGDVAPIFFHNKDDNAKKGSGLNGGVGINDLIANLYNQNQQIKVQNGSDPNSNLNGAISKSNESIANDDLRSSTKASNWSPNGFESIFHDTDPNSIKLDSTISGMNFSSNNGLSSDLVEQSESFDDDDDDGWEFKGANADKQEQRVVDLPGPNGETILWKDQETQVDGGGSLNVEEFKPTIEFSNSANGPVDILVQPEDSAGVWNFDFDFNPSSVSQDASLQDSYSEIKKNDMEIVLNFSSVVENGNSNENFWQFKDAFSEVQAQPKSEASQVATPAVIGGQAFNGDGIHGPTDLFAASEESFQKHGQWDFAFTFNSGSVTKDGIISDLHASSQKNVVGNGASSSADDKHDEMDDDFCEFQDAFSETVSKSEGESMVAVDPPSNMIPPTSNGGNQKNEVKSESHREALSLSIFGDEELENNATIHEDVSTHEPTSYPNYNNKAPHSNLSINDLISSLYSQAELNISVNDAQKVSENGLPTAMGELESDLINDDDDFDDDSWEFKDAFLGTKAQNQTSATEVVDLPCKSSTKLQLNDFVDFYCNLKEESFFVALTHFEILKKAESSAILSGEEAKAEALAEEIQKFYNQLYQDNTITEFESETLSSRNARLSELIKVLQEPNFRVLESEYHLSNQLSLAGTDLGSAIELSKHAASTLRVLKLGSAEEQSTYVSTWSKIISVCAQELQHGAFIWKQSMQKNIQSEILSVPQGKQYIIALGEIYRVVQVLRASVELYKPWVLLEAPLGFFRLLNDCTALWSTSGLDEALQSISESIDSEFNETLKALLESLKYMHDLDAVALQNHVFSGKQPICRLSLLTAGIVPGMEMVAWDGEYYLLKLANLWANQITSKPPYLPSVNFS